MKTNAFIFCLIFFSFCSFAGGDSTFKIIPLKKIPCSFNNGIKRSDLINFRSTFAPVPQQIDLTEGIILSVGFTALVPLMLDVYNERHPVSELAIGGLAVYGTCFLTALVYRFGFKGKHKKQEKWDR
jgi:hypothetical protein